jgi:hypothetical protein
MSLLSHDRTVGFCPSLNGVTALVTGIEWQPRQWLFRLIEFAVGLYAASLRHRTGLLFA